MRLFVPLIGLVALTACGSHAASGEPSSPVTSSEPRQAAIGQKPPPFSVPSLTTPGTVKVTPGKVVLVMFWATWNEPCKKAMPKLQELAHAYGSRGFEIAALSIDDEDEGDKGRSRVEEAARMFGARFPVGWDRGHAIAGAWRPTSVPTIYLVDRAGTIAHIHGGWHDTEETQLVPEIEALLERR